MLQTAFHRKSTTESFFSKANMHKKGAPLTRTFLRRVAFLNEYGIWFSLNQGKPNTI